MRTSENSTNDMPNEELFWQHDHTFGQELRRTGEVRTLIVMMVTIITMAVEIVAGIYYGSMALLADGLHMGSHAMALGISVFAYIYARRKARDERFCFGTGKVNPLAGYTSAILLLIFAVAMAWQSVERLITPVKIEFNQAIIVAVIGLIVNAASMLILGHHHADGHHHHHDDKSHNHHDHDHDHDHNHKHGDHDESDKHDHNLRAAYLHVLADTLTSVLAIAALLSGKYLGLVWMDPVMGIVGAILICSWSFGLIRGTSFVLLDQQGPEPLRDAITRGIESEAETRVSDLHLWSVGPGVYVLVLTVVAKDPQSPDHYKHLLPRNGYLAHVTIEVQREEESEGDK